MTFFEKPMPESREMHACEHKYDREILSEIIESWVGVMGYDDQLHMLI